MVSPTGDSQMFPNRASVRYIHLMGESSVSNPLKGKAESQPRLSHFNSPNNITCFIYLFIFLKIKNQNINHIDKAPRIREDTKTQKK
jgi:hypothetical protein